MGDESKKIELKTDDAAFLTFNYTPTLETLYNIDENIIFHIHGKAGTDDELVLGHGVSEGDIEKMLEKDFSIDEEEGMTMSRKEQKVQQLTEYITSERKLMK